MPLEVETMRRGQKVTVVGFDGEVADARVYDVQGKTAHVCSEEEWRRAAAEKRAPDCLGWPLTSVREARSEPLAVIDQNVR
jgi:hypothetical protein